MKLWQALIPIVILALVIKFVDKYFLETFNIRLSPILLVAIIVYWIIRKQRRKLTEEKEFTAKGIDKNKFIYAGTYLAGLPTISSTINTILLYPAENVLNIYNATTAHKNELIATLDWVSIKNILTGDNTLVEKSLTTEYLKKVLSLNKATKNSMLNNTAFLIIEWEYDNSLQSTVFAFGFETSLEKNLKMASIAQNTLKQNLSLHFT